MISGRGFLTPVLGRRVASVLRGNGMRGLLCASYLPDQDAEVGFRSLITTTRGPRSSLPRQANIRRNSFCHRKSDILKRFDAGTTTRDFSTALDDSESSPSYTPGYRSGIRNVAIIAHVDHGKTTLTDQLIKVANESEGQQDLNRLLDSGELEVERGITITSKVTRLDYTDSNKDQYTISIVDTPGHADFAGEVDRILSMVSGVCLIVDAAEGPKSQTKYVLSRALSLGLKPLVILNKADREDAVSRIASGETETQVLDLFDSLEADESQMDYLTLYASARSGWVTEDADTAIELAANGSNAEAQDNTMKILLDAIIKNVPEPSVRFYDTECAGDGTELYTTDKFSLAATTVGYDKYLGRTCTGRIYSGSVTLNDSVTILKRNPDDTPILPTTVTGLFVNRGISRTPLDPPIAMAGDIVTLAGIPDSMAVGDTVTGTNNPVPGPIETPPLAPPTLSMDFGANTGPLVGREGDIVTSTRIRSRLLSETDNNVTLSVTKSTTDGEKTVVYGRGELQLGILIEQMRREGFELMISPPRIVTSTCPESGKLLEPYEEVFVDVDSEFSGTVVNAMTGDRKGVLVEMTENAADGKARLVFEAPSRGLIGFGPEISTATRGSAVYHHCFIEDREHAGSLGIGLVKGKLVSNENGKASLYALSSLVERGTLFVEPGDVVYAGMVVGESNRDGDMEVNPVKSKQVTNMRTVNKDEKTYLPPAKCMTVEELIGYMNDDEIIEVTPKSVRLRKAELDAGARQRAARAQKKRNNSLKQS